MNIRRFYSDNISDELIAGVVSDEFHHLHTVLRKQVGDKIELFNGMGVLARGFISKIEKNRALVTIEERVEKSINRVETVLCPSLLKRKAMDLMIEKLSEMAIDEIRPVIFSRTDVKYKGESLKRWQKISLESLKVNGKLWPAKLFPPVNIDEIIKYSRNFRTKIIFDIEGHPGNILFNFPAIAVVGPPGDFTTSEKANLKKNNFAAININDAVLKTETAAFSAASIMKMYKTLL